MAGLICIVSSGVCRPYLCVSTRLAARTTVSFGEPRFALVSIPASAIKLPIQRGTRTCGLFVNRTRIFGERKHVLCNKFVVFATQPSVKGMGDALFVSTAGADGACRDGK